MENMSEKYIEQALRFIEDLSDPEAKLPYAEKKDIDRLFSMVGDGD